MPDLDFLFGADRQAKSNNAAGVSADLTFRCSVHPHPRSQQRSQPTSPSLAAALQTSSRNSLDSHRSSPLTESSPLSFAPAMSAPPGGYSYVVPVYIVVH